MFDVYVEGVAVTSPDAVHEVAKTMAARYGVPAAELHARLTRGRFRVKADVSRATAEAYVRDLEAIGVQVRIEPARPMRSSLPPQPEPRPASSSLPPPTAARPTRSSLPAQPESRPAYSSLPPPTSARPTHSSLSPPAASHRRTPEAAEAGLESTADAAMALGALDRSGVLSLATLDDDPAGASHSDGTLSASIGPAAPRPPSQPRPRSEPSDPFAPPDLAIAEPQLELAERSTSSQLWASSSDRRSMPSQAPAASTDARLLARPSGTSREPRSTSSALEGAASAYQRGALAAQDPARLLTPRRVRFAAGVVLAIVLGFLPAHLVAAIRERSAFSAIDHKVLAAQAAADTPESYAALDQLRAEQLDAKDRARRMIALSSLAIWAAAGGAIAYLWFRRIPWDQRGSR